MLVIHMYIRITCCTNSSNTSQLGANEAVCLLFDLFCENIILSTWFKNSEWERNVVSRLWLRHIGAKSGNVSSEIYKDALFLFMCLTDCIYIYSCRFVAFVHSIMMCSLLNIHPRNCICDNKKDNHSMKP